MSKVSEFFTLSTESKKHDWSKVVKKQHCSYLGKTCIKNRKSEPEISIGTCTVKYGKDQREMIICPHRLLENNKIFLDSIHLLTLHEPGNELHIVSEISVPGGSVDYFLVSAKGKKVKDFVGIELQTLDTTGTVWPERQRFLKEVGVRVKASDANSRKLFGMNWKMTAKTILIQLHHKIDTFENLNKHLVLVLQDCLLEYLQKEFSFDHISKNARTGDSMHFHAYNIGQYENSKYSISLDNRHSTDSEGISKCLGLQSEANVDLAHIIADLEGKLSSETLLKL